MIFSNKFRLFLAFILIFGLSIVIVPEAESWGRSEYTPCWESRTGLNMPNEYTPCWEGRTYLNMPYESQPYWEERVRVWGPPEYSPRIDPIFLLPRGPEYTPRFDAPFTLEDIQRRRGTTRCYECGYEDKYFYGESDFYDHVYPHRFYIVHTNNDSRVGHGYFVSPSRVLNNRNLIHN